MIYGYGIGMIWHPAQRWLMTEPVATDGDGAVPMPFSNLQAGILAVVVIAVLAFAAWAIRDKSRTGDSLLPDFVHGAARQ